MNEPIYQFDNILSTTTHLMSQSRVPVRSLTDPQVDNMKTSHKYLIENNLIVYEKYDRHGKLVSRVPCSPKSIDEKA